MSSDTLNNLRINMGYIRPGEEKSKTFFWLNTSVAILLAVAVAFMFGFHNEAEKRNEGDKNTVLAIAIILALGLFIYVVPIRLWDRIFSSRFSIPMYNRHPVYGFLAILLIFSLVYMGIFYGSWSQNMTESEKAYSLITISLIGVLLIFTIGLWIVTTFPYGWLSRALNIDIFSDDQLYGISPDEYNKYIQLKTQQGLLEKALNNQSSLTPDEQRIVVKLVGRDTNNSDFNASLNALLSGYPDSINNARKTIIAQGDFKTYFDRKYAELINKDEVTKDKTLQIVSDYYKQNVRNYNISNDFKQNVIEAINNTDDGFFTPEGYGEVFGYYDTSSGAISGAGAFARVNKVKNAGEIERNAMLDQSVQDVYKNVLFSKLNPIYSEILSDYTNNKFYTELKNKSTELYKNNPSNYLTELRKYAEGRSNDILNCNKKDLIGIYNKYNNTYQTITNNPYAVPRNDQAKLKFAKDLISSGANTNIKNDVKKILYKSIEDC